MSKKKHSYDRKYPTSRVGLPPIAHAFKPGSGEKIVRIVTGLYDVTTAIDVGAYWTIEKALSTERSNNLLKDETFIIVEPETLNSIYLFKCRKDLGEKVFERFYYCGNKKVYNDSIERIFQKNYDMLNKDSLPLYRNREKEIKKFHYSGLGDISILVFKDKPQKTINWNSKFCQYLQLCNNKNFNKTLLKLGELRDEMNKGVIDSVKESRKMPLRPNGISVSSNKKKETDKVKVNFSIDDAEIFINSAFDRFNAPFNATIKKGE